MTTNDTNQAVDLDLAQVLAEHHSRQGMVGPEHKCVKCDVWFSNADAFADHQAAMILAHFKEQGTMSVWRFTYPATGRMVERTTIIWERDL